MNLEYNTLIYNAKKAFLIALPIFILILFLLIITGRALDSPMLGVIGFINVSILPFIFQKKLKQFFTKKINIVFTQQSLIFKIKNLKDESIKKEVEYQWADIESYKFYFTQSKMTYLDIYLRNGKRREFGFKDNKTQNESLNSESVFIAFHSFIKQYNLNRNERERITLIPGFLVTKKGTTTLWLIGFLAVTAIGIHLFEQPNSSPFSLVMGLFILLGLIAKRKQDKELFEKIGVL